MLKEAVDGNHSVPYFIKKTPNPLPLPFSLKTTTRGGLRVSDVVCRCDLDMKLREKINILALSSKITKSNRNYIFFNPTTPTPQSKARCNLVQKSGTQTKHNSRFLTKFPCRTPRNGCFLLPSQSQKPQRQSCSFLA